MEKPIWLCMLLSFALSQSGSFAASFRRINIDLYVMSMCPDAHECHKQLLEGANFARDYTRLNFHYIGSRDNSTGLLTCMHGRQECVGNIQQLCVQKYSTTARQRFEWMLRFSHCDTTRRLTAFYNQQPITDTFAACALEARIPTATCNKIRSCRRAAATNNMLQLEFNATRSVGIKTSCTVQVDGVVGCVMEDGQWRDCPGGSGHEGFVRTLCDAFEAKNSLKPAQNPVAWCKSRRR